MSAGRCPASPQWGEIRIGSKPANENSKQNHEYVGSRPYLVTSNNVFNAYSDVVSVIPFTSRRNENSSPSHVKFVGGEINGLPRDSTLMCENETLILKHNLSAPVARLNEEQLARVARACVLQKPMLALAGDMKNDETYQRIVRFR